MQEVSHESAAFGRVGCGERQAGRLTIIDLEGSITVGDGAAALRREARRLIAAGCPDLLLNLSRVRYVDSCGLGEIVATQLAARRGGGQVALLAPRPNVRELIEVTALTGVFDIYVDEAAAVEGMAAGRD